MEGNSGVVLRANRRSRAKYWIFVPFQLGQCADFYLTRPDLKRFLGSEPEFTVIQRLS
jgi:hypothetical protein